MENYNAKLKILTISFFLLLGFFGFAGSLQAATILDDDFEYGQDTQNCVETMSLSGWKWSYCKDQSSTLGAKGYISISSIHSHSGSKSMLMNFLPFTFNGQTDLFPQSYNSFGNNVWMEMWIYPAYEPGMYSRFDTMNKWIYAWPPATYGNPGHWCLRFHTPRRYTGYKSWSSFTTPLPDDHSGLFLSFDQQGCAQVPPIGQNLGSDNDFIPMNQWSRLIIHVDSSVGASPNMEAWINGVKVAEHTVTWTYGEGIDTARIKIGTTFPGPGQSTNYLDSWIFVDDVKMATSRDDIDWGTPPDTTPPASPTGLTVN